MLRNILPLFFLVVLGFSCNKEEYEVIPEEKPQAPAQEEPIDTDTGSQMALTGCTDERAINASGASYDDNSCQYTPTACADCDYIVDVNQYFVDNAELNLPAGSTIGIKGGSRKAIYINNFHGTADKPFLFINCDGQALIEDGSVGIKIHDSSFIRVTGTGSTDDYGIKITTDLHGVQAEHGTSDFEVDHIEIAGTGSIGFPARTNPDEEHNRSNFVQYNTLIHHNYIHDTGNEGIYVGGSHWQDESRNEPLLKGVRVYNNRVENTGYDGIQVGSAVEDSEIYNNVVINYGLRGVTYHQSGLQINPGTTGKIYNNLVKGGTGNAIFLSGFDNEVYNNLVVDCQKYGMYIADRGPLPNQSYRIFNNTLVNVGRETVKMTSSLSVNNVFYNNVMVNTGGEIVVTDNVGFELSNNFTSASVSDAVFRDPANLDFTPLENSPLTDGGKAITEVEISGDYLFNTRITGGAMDIGAFEYQQ